MQNFLLLYFAYYRLKHGKIVYAVRYLFRVQDSCVIIVVLVDRIMIENS